MGWSLRLQELGRTSGGVFDREMALQAGVPADAIDHEVRVGRLVVAHPGVYRPAAVIPTTDLTLRAALLAAGPDAAISHRSAALRHGILGRSYSGYVDIVVPHHRRVRLAGVSVHRSLRLQEGHVRRVDGQRITSVERTLADLGAVVRSSVVASAMEQAVIDRLTTVERLFRFVDDHGRRGRTGIGALRAALEGWILGDRPPDSKLEIVLARVVRRGGLPIPQYQLKIYDGTTFIARPDAVWPAVKVVVEADGHHAHASAAALQHDHRRQNALVLRGWTVLRFTWTDLVRRVDRVAAEIAAVLSARGLPVLGSPDAPTRVP